jgi:ketosteroid isomerase-like protein
MDRKAAVKTFYDAWDRTKGSPEAVEVAMDILADDAEFHSMADGGDGESDLAFTQPRRGKAKIREYFNLLGEGWTMQHYTVRRLLSDDDTVMALVDLAWTNKATGKVAAGRKADVWRFEGDKAVSFEEYYNPLVLQRAATA